MFSRALAAAVVTAWAAPAVHAQAYPTKSVRILAGFAPGGGTDIMARTVAAKLSESREMVQRLKREMALARADVKERLASRGADVVATSPEETAAIFRTDLAKYTRLAQAANNRAD